LLPKVSIGHRALARDGSFTAARVPTRAAAPTHRGQPVDWREARVDGTAALLDRVNPKKALVSLAAVFTTCGLACGSPTVLSVGM